MKQSILWVVVSSFTCSLLAISPVPDPIPEEAALKRVRSHLFIRDPFSAVKEGKQGVKMYPNSLKLRLAYLEALCQKGEEVEAFELFSSLFSRPEDINTSQRSVLEWLAWGVLNKGEDSSLLLVRLYSLLGAAFTQDARAIPLFLKELQGSNALLRSLAVKVSAHYGDAPLRQELLRLLKEEKVWFVRLEVIHAIGMLKMLEAQKTLQEIIVNPKALVEEKGSAILALAGMYETISREELGSLIASDRAGLRQLAAEIICHLELRENLPLLLPLLEDASPYVRVSVMKTFGLLGGVGEQQSLLVALKKNLKDSHPEVAIAAAWLATVLGHEEGKASLKKWIEQERVEPKRLAAAALAITGVQGVGLMQKMLAQQDDVYVRVNLAIGLIGQRKSIEEASEVLFQSVSMAKKELWMWDQGENGFFRTLSPSKVSHREEMPKYPQVVDQLVQLDILSILSIVHHPKAVEAMKGFLQNHSWGITGAAASALLQEGDEGALEVVKELLKDPDEKIRVQAALILALLGGDPEAVHVLIEAYPHVDREMKLHLLEALGQIGDPSALPFLVALLKEPFQGLRVVAAAALIQCLYH